MNASPGTRSLALEVLRRIDEDGAYANLALGAALDRSALDRRDRAFCTDLVYGTTRMRRACDHLIDRFLHDDVEPVVRRVLRLGAYQLRWGGVPPHAAVSATVDTAPKRARGLCNAVLRRLAEHDPEWPSPAVVRADGYHQDRVSQLVAGLAVEGLAAGGSLLDLCAAPGGKATSMAGSGAWVVAADLRMSRLGLVRSNAERVGVDLQLVQADGHRPPFRLASFDRVLVDAPCSGLGVLRRRADARWRIEPDDVERLADLQVRLLEAALPLVRPGGQLIYSVCTVTAAETTEVDERIRALAELRTEAPGAPWRPLGSGGLLLPQDLDSEGMAVFRYRVG